MEALKLTWLVVTTFCSWLWCWYIINRIFAYWGPLMKAVNKELWWVVTHIAAPITALSYLSNGIDRWDYIFFPIHLYLWWDIYNRDDHDDRWKKRRKKATSKVKEVAGKLVVVPLPKPA